MPGTRHYYFLNSIGAGDWFTSYGTTLADVRYAVEGYAAFDGAGDDAANLPEEVIFHYPACYGGDVWEGYGIYNYIRGLAAKGVKTTSLIEGMCASIATLTAMAADTVMMADAAFWMVHKPHLDSYSADANEHAAAVVILNKIQDQLAGRYVARSGGKLDLATAHELMNQTSWLNADECIGHGFITGKIADAPLVVPVGAEKVLNFLSPAAYKPKATMLNDTEKKGLFAEFKNWLTGETPKASTAKTPKAEAAPVADPAPKNDDSAAATGTEMALSDGTSVFVDTTDDGVADIDEGDAVFTDEAMTTPVADGDYTLEDSRDFTVAGGVVTVIAADPAAAEAAAAAPAQAAAVAPKAPQPMSPQAKLKVAEARAEAAEAKLRAHVPGAGNPLKSGAQAFAGSDSAAAHPLDAAAKKVNDKLHRGI